MWAFRAPRYLWSYLRRAGIKRSIPRAEGQVIKSMMSGGTIAAAMYASSISPPAALSAVPDDAAQKNHHRKNKKGFTNPWDSCKEAGFLQVILPVLARRFSGELKSPDTTPPTVPVIKPTFLPSRNASDALRATWLGHACYYVEFPGGLRVLFDPVFESRCSPFAFLGPKRYTEKPCEIKDIPVVDAIVISHSHYDHLSHPTVLELHRNHPNAQFFVGMGLKKWFLDCGIHNVVEMDWWTDSELTLTLQTSPEKGAPTSSSTSLAPSNITARISCLPCQHTSARTPWDKAVTLWCSWAVESGGKKVWFGGDTGYRAVPHLPKGVDDYGEKYKDLPRCPAFKQIGDLRGPFDLGLIPIGAYDPRDIMSSVHANPFDSVNIFVDTKCKRAMGIHWGTWVLTTEDVLEPPALLKEAMERKGLPPTGVFDVCDIGESREF